MFGLINSQIGTSLSISSFAIFLLAAVASVTDVARGRIYNWLTLPLTLAALIFATVTQSFAHAYQYGRPDALGFDDPGGPKNHPRIPENGVVRLFINPDIK